MKLDKQDTRLRRALRGRVKIKELARVAPFGAPHAAATSMRRSSRREGRQGSGRRLDLQKDVRGDLKTTGNIEAAKAVGRAIAERAKAKGIGKVAFDRSGFMYHGRIKALADAAREAGLEF